MLGAQPDAKTERWVHRETSVPVSQQDGDVPGLAIGHDQIAIVVAIHVAMSHPNRFVSGGEFAGREIGNSTRIVRP